MDSPVHNSKEKKKKKGKEKKIRNMVCPTLSYVVIRIGKSSVH